MANVEKEKEVTGNGSDRAGDIASEQDKTTAEASKSRSVRREKPPIAQKPKLGATSVHRNSQKNDSNSNNSNSNSSSAETEISVDKTKNLTEQGETTNLWGASGSRRRGTIDSSSEAETARLQAIVSEGSPQLFYSVEDILSAGSFGMVCVAKHKSSGVKAAIKVIDLRQQHEEKDLVLEEMEFLKQNTHPNICNFLACYSLDKELWIVMEYLDAGTLDCLVKLTTLEADVMATLCRECVKGLQFLHSHDIVHEELRSSSVMLSNLGEVKLTDFGFCSQLRVDTETGHSAHPLTSPHWMAPEVVARKDSSNQKDIWSLGILLVEMVDGEPPYANQSAFKVILNIASNGKPQVKQTGRMTPDMSDFMDQCLHVEPTSRPTASSLLDHKFLTTSATVDELKAVVGIMHSAALRKKKKHLFKRAGPVEQDNSGTASPPVGDKRSDITDSATVSASATLSDQSVDDSSTARPAKKLTPQTIEDRREAPRNNDTTALYANINQDTSVPDAAVVSTHAPTGEKDEGNERNRTDSKLPDGERRSGILHHDLARSSRISGNSVFSQSSLDTSQSIDYASSTDNDLHYDDDDDDFDDDYFTDDDFMDDDFSNEYTNLHDVSMDDEKREGEEEKNGKEAPIYEDVERLSALVVIKDKAHRVAYELMMTEKNYVEELHLLHCVFFGELVAQNNQRNFVSMTSLQCIFSNLSSIYQFHHGLLFPDLVERLRNWSEKPKIGDVTKKYAPLLKMYSEYVSNFPVASKLLRDLLGRCQKFARAVKEIEKLERCKKLTLLNHLLEPVQRVPRYKLFLENYLKKLPEDSEDIEDTTEALSLVSEAALHIEATLRNMERYRILESMKRHLSGAPENFVTATREFISQGTVTKLAARSGERQTRYLFLFNDLVLICLPQAMGTHTVKCALDVDGMLIKPGVFPYMKDTFIVHSRQRAVELQDWNMNNEATKWREKIQEVIDKYKEQRKSRGELETSLDLDNPENLLGEMAPLWVPDSAVTSCMVCDAQFGMVTRKHHCRCCGKVICKSCCKKMTLSFMKGDKQRVCVACYAVVESRRNECKSISFEPTEEAEDGGPDRKKSTKINRQALLSQLQELEKEKATITSELYALQREGGRIGASITIDKFHYVQHKIYNLKLCKATEDPPQDTVEMTGSSQDQGQGQTADSADSSTEQTEDLENSRLSDSDPERTKTESGQVSKTILREVVLNKLEKLKKEKTVLSREREALHRLQAATRSSISTEQSDDLTRELGGNLERLSYTEKKIDHLREQLSAEEDKREAGEGIYDPQWDSTQTAAPPQAQDKSAESAISESQISCSETSAQARRLTVLYKFEGTEEMMVSIEEGEEVEEVEADTGDGWTKVRTSDGRVGLAPASYLDPVSEN
ncbi:uncharacterized protein LOC101863251 [Aplysia californica]|uniref:Uncharacterized protein LOC101863251 n=1 Tax=Aplysia californica TaxID=6500 RepID=A0ABM0ZWE5_APLCA|nr:uncharacterized protein LOC101863251 [Aplysia californica]